MVGISRPESPLGSPCNFTSPTKDKGWERRRKGKIGRVFTMFTLTARVARLNRRKTGTYISNFVPSSKCHTTMTAIVVFW